MKVCTKCGTEKEVTEFYTTRHGNLEGKCMACRRSLNSEWYRKNKTNVEVKRKEDRHADPVKHMLHRAKARAKREGLPFNLEHQDIEVPDVCPVLSIPLVIGEGSGGEDGSPSLDKFIPMLGYVKGNVSVISWRANSLKRNGTLAEMEALVTWMQNQTKPIPPYNFGKTNKRI